MQNKIKNLIIECLNYIKKISEADFEISDELVLLGENGALDSLNFVSFIADLEEKIADEFGKNIAIVSDKAFSRQNSPFKNIDTLSLYVSELLKVGA